MSLNDPNWGRQGGSRGPGGGNQGPPDLDELWRNFNRRLGELFGKRRGGGGGEPPRLFSGPSIGGAGLLGGIVLAVWLASGFYIVVEGQRGVVLTFGKFAAETTSGLNWRMPWPVQSHEIVNLSQVRTLEVGYRNNVKTRVLKESLMLTDDENIVDLQFAVQYIVRDARQWLFNTKRPDETAMQAAETSMREIIGKSKMDQILYESREAIQVKAQQLMQQILDRYKTGINITTVNLQNVQAPEQVQASFEDVVRAGQDRERFKNEGQAYANDVIPKAKGVAARLIEEANGYKQSIVSTAQGDASRFRQVLAEYEKAPQVTRERIYLDTMQQIMGSTSKVIVDQKGGQNLLYLPLNEIMRMTGQVTVEPRASAAETPAAPAPEPIPSRRDSLRSRDREAAR